MSRKTILIADLEQPALFMQRVLRAHYDARTIFTLSNAITALENVRYDLVICGMHFDESRMFEFLGVLRELPGCSEIPFLCIRALPAQSEIISSVRATHDVLGAVGFIELSSFDADDEKLLVETVKNILG